MYSSENDAVANKLKALFQGGEEEPAMRVSVMDLLRRHPCVVAARAPGTSYSLLHVACCLNLPWSVQALLASGADVNDVDECQATPLHYLCANELEPCDALACARALLAAEPRASLAAVTRDAIVGTGVVRIHCSGGRSPLHFAAEAGASQQLVHLLVAAGADKRLRDHDGCTAWDLCVRRRASLCLAPFLAPSLPGVAPWQPVPESPERHRARVRRIEAAVRVFREQQHAAYDKACRAAHRSVHPWLYRAALAWAHDDQSKEAERIVVPELRAVLALPAGQRDHSLRAMAAQVVPGVFRLPCLRPSFCTALLEELVAFEASLGRRVRRPNSMNNGGVILADVYHDGVSLSCVGSVLTQRVMVPLGLALRAHLGGVATVAVDPSVTHAFVVSYHMDQDRKLAKHVDACSLTLNVALGKHFRGGALGFYGRPALHEPDELQGTHVAHVPGHALIHVGKHRHLATPIDEGERMNGRMNDASLFWYVHPEQAQRVLDDVQVGAMEAAEEHAYVRPRGMSVFPGHVKLPWGIEELIASYLDHSALVALAQTCHAAAILVQSPRVWRALLLTQHREWVHGPPPGAMRLFRRSRGVMAQLAAAGPDERDALLCRLARHYDSKPRLCALRSYERSGWGELSFHKGEVLVVAAEVPIPFGDPAGWTMVVSASGQLGCVRNRMMEDPLEQRGTLVLQARRFVTAHGPRNPCWEV